MRNVNPRCLLLGLLLLPRPCLAAGERPNILYINADDLGVMDVRYARQKDYHTPHVDRLAREGMVFTDGYAPAANCAPSRAVCMSGQYTPRHGVYTVGSSERGQSRTRKLIPIPNKEHLDDRNITMAEALQSAGYKTIHLGKWHLGKDPCTQGFDVNVGGEAQGGPYDGKKYFSPWTGTMKKFNDRYPVGTHRADVFWDQANAFMEKHRDGPFFVYMAYYLVHSPLQAVKRHAAKYAGKDVNPAYASMVEMMDESIGKILGKVDELGLRDRTLVVFTSDNGGVANTSSQRPYRAGKGSYFEGGTRVPFVMRWPGVIKAGSVCRTPVSGVDLYPTFLQATGTPKPDGKILDGESLMPLMTGRGAFPDRALFWHFPVYLQLSRNAAKAYDTHDPLFRCRPGTTMRYGKWKLHEYFEDGRLELYDLAADVGERKNLAGEMPEQAGALHKMMVAWRKKTKAPVPSKLNPDYDP